MPSHTAPVPSPTLAERWSLPSALKDWTNAGLVGHLARSAFNLERALSTIGQHDEKQPILDTVGYYLSSAPHTPDSPVGRRIRELGAAEAAEGPALLASRFAASAARLQDRAVPLHEATTVEMFTRVMSIDDCATACLLELVVHTDDLAESLDLHPPAFDDQAVDLVMCCLTRICRRRHGDTAVVRTLARTDRAPAAGISAF